jgi:hypothetical protein
MKSGKQTFFLHFILSGAKSYSHSHSQKDPGSGIRDPGSRKNSSWIRIQGVKSTGYGSGSPTLVQNLIYHFRKKTAENVGKRILQICLRIISGDSISIPIFDF